MTQHLSFHPANGNMHAVDELASVREKIAELKKIEAELRDRVLNNPYDRVGDIYQAEVMQSTQSRICQEKVKELVGDLDRVKKSVDVTFVRLNKIGSR